MARKKQNEQEKQTISCTEKGISQYDLQGRLDDIAATIAKWRAAYGGDAYLDMDFYRSYYDSIDVDVEIRYTRLETDEEVEKRIKAADRARQAAVKRRAQEKETKKKKEADDLAALIKKHPELAKQLLDDKK